MAELAAILARRRKVNIDKGETVTSGQGDSVVISVEKRYQVLQRQNFPNCFCVCVQQLTVPLKIISLLAYEVPKSKAPSKNLRLV
jgi:hypothetical protein